MLRDIDTYEAKKLNKSTLYWAKGALQALDNDDSYTYHELYDALGVTIDDMIDDLDNRIYNEPEVALSDLFFSAWRFLFPTYQTLPAPYQCWSEDLKNYLLIKHATK